MVREEIKHRRHAHPGGKKRKGRGHTKGRQLVPDAVAEVSELLGNQSRRRDLLIEYLHLIQDKYNQISAAHLAALAEEMQIPMAEAYEVATFYAHFDVLKEGDAPLPELTIRVCDSLTCEMMGAESLLRGLNANYNGTVRIARVPCMGRCDVAPVAEVGHNHITSATVASVKSTVDAGRMYPDIPDYKDYDAYRVAGGYSLLDDCLAGKRTPDELIEIMSGSGIRGLGGAGFPTGTKWNIVRNEARPRLMAVNADEGEPGTFKDKLYLGSDPHRMLEGMLIAAWVVEAETVYIYLRDEYPGIREVLLGEIAKVEAAGLDRVTKIELRRGAGAYICGEESAMIESIEGKRGLPRHRPPYVAQVGIFGRPTLVNNVETLFWVRDIVEKGPDWFADQGKGESKGLRSYSVSGRVKEPGVKLVAAGVTARELIEEYSGGMSDGHTFKGYLPGGASGGILPADMGDLPLDFGKLEEHDCFVGSHAVVILSDQDHMGDVARNLMRFFEHESCGQCTPCRVGTEKSVKLMEAEKWDESLLTELGSCMGDASICGLGQAAANPLFSVLKHFREDVT
jgi:NADH:ubiquinone oxidoreductase subunit F (NADH-binding)/NADH:ubiquinone oxidoreductase subunit E